MWLMILHSGIKIFLPSLSNFLISISDIFFKSYHKQKMKSSYTYKKINNLEIKLDVHIPPSATAENPAPVIVWYHGGFYLLDEQI